MEYNFLSWTDLDAKLLVMDQANDYPDVTQINEVENAVRAGALEPIEPYLEKSDILSLENFNQVGLDTVFPMYSAPMLTSTTRISATRPVLIPQPLKPGMTFWRR